jgi:hypothetical protein
MNKTSFVTEKSVVITEKLEDSNPEINLMETKFDEQPLLIATEPWESRITINTVGKKKLITKEHYPQRMIVRRARRDWIEGDVEESENDNHMALVYFPEPEVIDDEFDIKVGNTFYRVSINLKSNKVWCNEIVSFNYKGIVLLKNPVEKQKSDQMLELFKSLNVAKNNRNDTIKNFRQKVEKFYKQEELKSQPKNQPKGNLPDPTLMEAACWCIAQNPRPKYKRPTLLRAFKKFGKKSHTEGSFITMVRNKWSNILKAYDKMPDDFKKANSEQIYAKTELKVVRKIRKQRTKGDEMRFN